MRQAYDYWQDQPGNYFPKPLSWPSVTRGVPGALSAFTMWSSSTFVCVKHSRPTVARGQPSPLREGVQATSNPQMASPCFPFSHVLSKIPSSRRETKVTALDEDYQRPATPERHAQTWRIPQWLAASGLTIGKQSTSFNIARSHHIRMGRGFKGEQSQQASQPPGPSSSNQPSHEAGLFDST